MLNEDRPSLSITEAAVFGLRWDLIFHLSVDSFSPRHLTCSAVVMRFKDEYRRALLLIGGPNLRIVGDPEAMQI
jgi:hypothetical protein